MTTIYISDYGDDENDGRTKDTAIYSWGRAMQLCNSSTETNLMQGGATLKRLHRGNQTLEEKIGGPTEASEPGTLDPIAG